MSARPITQELYAAAIAYFRKNSGDHTGCARHLGLDRRTALRLWEGPTYTNWPWARPIRDVLSEEQTEENRQMLLAEQQMHETMLAERAKAERIAREAAEVDENILRLARNNVLHGLAAGAKVATSMSKLADRLTQQLERGTDSAGNKLPDIPLREFMRIARDFSGFNKGLLETAQVLLDIERLRNGLPTTIIGVDTSRLSSADIERELSMANFAAHEAARMQGHHNVIEAPLAAPQQGAQE